MVQLVVIDLDSGDQLLSTDITTGVFADETPTVNDEVVIPNATPEGPYKIIHRRFVTEGIAEVRLLVRYAGQ